MIIASDVAGGAASDPFVLQFGGQFRITAPSVGTGTDSWADLIWHDELGTPHVVLQISPLTDGTSFYDNVDLVAGSYVVENHITGGTPLTVVATLT